MSRALGIIILLFSYSIYSQNNYSDPSLSFANLEYSYGVRYNPKVSEIIEKRRDSYPKVHPLYTDEFGRDDIVIIKTKLNTDEKDLYYVLFTQGPSGDPSFYFINVKKPNKYFGNLAGEELVLPGNGFAYTKSRSNSDYLKRAKFKIAQYGFEEVFQPFYYVGLNSHTLVPVAIYKEIGKGKIIAKLPANYEVEVLVTDNNSNYLIKTSFGLLGWIHIPSTQYKSEIIEGISFQGD